MRPVRCPVECCIGKVIVYISYNNPIRIHNAETYILDCIDLDGNST